MFIATEKEESLDTLVRKLWSLESIGIVEPDNKDFMQRFHESVWFNERSGRYCVSLPG